jgi:hypothetical protein
MTFPTKAQAVRRLHSLGYHITDDGGGGSEIWQGTTRAGRVFSEAALIAWQPPEAEASEPIATTTPADGPLLSIDLQDRARRYVVARRRGGEALIEAVRELAAARAEAEHGAWGIFLEAIGLDESTARAQLRMHEAIEASPVIADKVRTGWLSASTARELLAAPLEVQAEILDQAEPPTRSEIRAAKRAPAPPVLEVEQPKIPEVAPTAPPCEECGQPATTRRNIGGWSTYRCDACTALALHQATEDAEASAAADGETRTTFGDDICDRAERLGAQIDYIGQRADGRLPVLPPPTHNQQWLHCDAAELRDLCAAWERPSEAERPGIEDRLHLALTQAARVVRLLEDVRWIDAKAQLRELCATMDIEVSA